MANGRGGPVRQAEHLHHVVHAVHADHHELGVADPGDVDDAEDQIEPEREQRQHAAEQDAVDHGLQQVDVEDVEEVLHAALPISENRCPLPDHAPYACLMVSVFIISAEVPDARMEPASSR